MQNKHVIGTEIFTSLLTNSPKPSSSRYMKVSHQISYNSLKPLNTKMNDVKLQTKSLKNKFFTFKKQNMRKYYHC